MCGVSLDDWANGGTVNVFPCIVSIVLVLWGVDAILGNAYGIQGQNYFALLQESKMSEGFHYKNMILGICFRLITLNVFQLSND